MEFYDKTGSVICYFHDDRHIFLWDGGAVAHMKNKKIYAYSGKFLGWYDNGWLYDLTNRPSLFSREAVGGPLKPMKKLKSLKGLRALKPLKGIRQITPIRPLRSMSWASCSGNDYFSQ